MIGAFELGIGSFEDNDYVDPGIDRSNNRYARLLLKLLDYMPRAGHWHVKEAQLGLQEDGGPWADNGSGWRCSILARFNKPPCWLLGMRFKYRPVEAIFESPA